MLDLWWFRHGFNTTNPIQRQSGNRGNGCRVSDYNIDPIDRQACGGNGVLERWKTNARIDLRETKLEWLKILEAAQTMIARLPAEDIGCLYLDSSGRPVCAQPDSANFKTLTRHFGSVKGAWPKVAGS